MSDDATAQPADLDEFLGVKPPSKRRKYLKWGAIAVGLLLLVLLVSRCVAPKPQGEYLTRAAERSDLTVTVTATGTLKGASKNRSSLTG